MLTTWRRYLREHPRTVDVTTTLLLFACSFPGSRFSPPGTPAKDQWWPAVLLTGIAAASLLRRRTRPRTVTVLTAVSGIAVTALGYLPSIFVHGPLIVALFTLAERTDRKTANAIAFPTVALVVLAAVIANPHGSISTTVVAPAAALLLPLSLGTVIKTRRSYLQAVRARAEFAEQTREQEARHRVAEERMRIARELHDVVAHHLALANAQAGTVAHLIRTRPDQAEKMVADLAGTTASALRELKATVGLLRQADEPAEPLQPAPNLAQLPQLTAALAAAGLAVTVSTEGDARPLSPGLELTAYRIIQEALTNVTRHAATNHAQVVLRYSLDSLTVTITNEIHAVAAAAPERGSGFGLIGMRERAQSVGGTLRTERRHDGVFEVTAQLPAHCPAEEEAAR